ncbi:MAG: hypothetical protein DMG12_06735 [Acidobacteria bacterium]|nr:MAG: hypothetical protein DMG12_06735 [Acidobacteriota bacterium]
MRFDTTFRTLPTKEILMKRTWIAVGVWVVLCSVLLAQAPAAKNMIGTWKLNPAKSTFSPGPALKSQTAKLDPVDGGMKVVADRVEADGKLTHFEWTAKFDGKDYPVKGDPARDAVSVKKIDDYTLEITNKKGGKALTTIRAVYARDGKTRTETTTGTNAQGQKVHNVTAWDKQ